MATRAEQHQAEEQRKNREANGRGRAAKKSAGKTTRAKKHAGRKATYALEEGTNASKRPSRKSTRKSANRSKPDASLVRREGMKKGAPTAKFRKSAAKGTKARAKSKKS